MLATDRDLFICSTPSNREGASVIYTGTCQVRAGGVTVALTNQGTGATLAFFSPTYVDKGYILESLAASVLRQEPQELEGVRDLVLGQVAD